MSEPLNPLYTRHVAERQLTTGLALEETGFDRLLLHSGKPFTYFADDNDAPFHPTPHFAHWAPVEGPDHILEVTLGKRPRLVRVTPRDFWYAPPAKAPDFVRAEFDVVDVETPEAAWMTVSNGSRHTAFIGAETGQALERGLPVEAINPEALLARLDWERSYKSDYEVACLAEATARAAGAFRAAEAAFRAGRSEMEIHHEYVSTVGDVDDALPYTTIIALDERSATLHYHGKRGKEAAPGKVFLIDAGASVRGYGSDITRTYVADGAHPVFVRLLDGMKAIQHALARGGRPGLPYPELHLMAHREIAKLLVETGVLLVSPEDAFSRGLTHPFLPHGLGHFLGIQVHDVAGRQARREGGTNPPPEGHRYLRTTRVIEPRMVYTIEPGLYFIPMLLEPHRGGPDRSAFDWALVDQLVTCGGIRVEDDVVVGEESNRNLTREALPE